jgi:hypothetical protein
MTNASVKDHCAIAIHHIDRIDALIRASLSETGEKVAVSLDECFGHWHSAVERFVLMQKMEAYPFTLSMRVLRRSDDVIGVIALPDVLCSPNLLPLAIEDRRQRSKPQIDQTLFHKQLRKKINDVVQQFQ